MLEYCHILSGAALSSHSSLDIIQNHLHVLVDDYFPTDNVCLMTVLNSQIEERSFKYFVRFTVPEIEVEDDFNEIEWTLAK